MNLFLRKFTAFSFVVLLADFCWNYGLPASYFIGPLWFIFIFFLLYTYLFHLYLTNAAKDDAKKYIRIYLGATALKMFVSLIIIAIGIVLDKANALPFALAFAVHYFAGFHDLGAVAVADALMPQANTEYG